jgi:hypothetical protein
MLHLFNKQPKPQDLSDQAQRILSGQYRKWDVDDYENADPKGPKLKDLHMRILSFGLPEEWVKLGNTEKGKLYEIIAEMRELEPDSR